MYPFQNYSKYNIGISFFILRGVGQKEVKGGSSTAFWSNLKMWYKERRRAGEDEDLYLFL
jgi:hypothetical protein